MEWVQFVYLETLEKSFWTSAVHACLSHLWYPHCCSSCWCLSSAALWSTGCWDKTQTDFSQRVLSHHPAMLETHLQNFSKPHMIPNSIANRQNCRKWSGIPKIHKFLNCTVAGDGRRWQHKWGETICWQVQSRVYNEDWKTSYHYDLDYL